MFAISTPAAVEPADVPEALAAALESYAVHLEASDVQLDPAAVDQINAGSDAARAIIASGVVGSGAVSIAISGHGNPEHKPAAGQPVEYVTVTVTSAEPVPAPTA